MSFINNLTGKPFEESAILLEVGVPTSITGKTYLLDASLRNAVRKLEGKKLYMSFGSPKAGTNALDQSRTCGEISNIKLVESRQHRGFAVIIGDVKPHGPFGVHLRDVMAGSIEAHYSMHAMIRPKQEAESSTYSIGEIVNWNLIAK